MASRLAWLTELQVDDDAIVESRNGSCRLVRVTRVTTGRITCGELVFIRRTGRLVGGTSCLVALTQEHMDRIWREAEVAKLRREIAALEKSIDKLTLQQLRQLVEALGVILRGAQPG